MDASRVANELLATVVKNGATRQVVAATVSALFRLLLNFDGDLVDEVRDRMAARVSGYIISGSAEKPFHEISTADAKHLQETWRTKAGDWQQWLREHPSPQQLPPRSPPCSGSNVYRKTNVGFSCSWSGVW